MKKSLLLVIVSLLLSASSQVVAQNPPGEVPGPPKVLLVVREDIKPGMMPAHNKHSATFAKIFTKLQTPNERIAMVPVAGSENEVVYLTGADSFAELAGTMEATDKKMSAVDGSTKAELDRLEKEAPELHTAMRDMLAIFRPELSFNPTAPIPQMRYFSVTTVRIRPGHDAQYADYVQKVVNVARQKAKVDNLHLATYQIISGAPGGTYMYFRPMKSLGELDEPIGMKVRSAMSDDMKKDADKSASDAIMSSDTSTYMFLPGMSYVSKEFAATDPDFWHPKAEMAAKPKPKRKTAKAAPPSPPAK
jgi:hypothetical protein